MMHFHSYRPDPEGHVHLAGVDLLGTPRAHTVNALASSDMRRWTLEMTHPARPWSCSTAAWQEMFGYVALVLWGIVVHHEGQESIAMTTFPGGASRSMLAAARYNARAPSREARSLQHLFGIETDGEAPYLLVPALCAHLSEELEAVAPTFFKAADLWGVHTGPRTVELFTRLHAAIDYAAKNKLTFVVEP